MTAAIRRILCPIDFSDCSRRALDQALVLARWSGASVTVLHVSPPAAGALGLEPGMAVLPSPDALAEEVKRFVAERAVPGVAAEVSIRAGPAAAEIREQAASTHADLLVLGTRGRSVLKRLLLGSVAEQVLRSASCPVLTVPPHQPDAVPVPAALYAEILCPVDFSDVSNEAVRLAVSLAEGAKGRVTVVHVLGHDLRSTPDLYDTVISDGRRSDEEVRERRVAYVRERLREIVTEAAATRCRVDVSGPDGPPARQILRLAAERRSDLIVLGIQPRSGSDLLVFGSTTHDVLREATCAVLTIRGDRTPG
jgi:nucleotide-binding universal stress UspA family protein